MWLRGKPEMADGPLKNEEKPLKPPGPSGPFLLSLWEVTALRGRVPDGPTG